MDADSEAPPPAEDPKNPDAAGASAAPGRTDPAPGPEPALYPYAEDAFARVTRFAESLFRAKAAICLVAECGRWFKSRTALDEVETPCGPALAYAVMKRNAPLVLKDASLDPQFSSDQVVGGDIGLRFFAGAPLRTKSGEAIGALYLYDDAPRAFGDADIAMLAELATIAADQTELRAAAASDELTGALSRRAFGEQAERALALALRHDHKLSIVAFDIDKLRRVNETFGHTIGDAVLNRTVAACARELRASDFIGRLGGEEFAVVLPFTSAADGVEFAERLRKAVSSEIYQSGAETFGITASFGVASRLRCESSVRALLSEAEAAVHLAKIQGRDRCVTARPAEVARTLGGKRRVFKAGRIMFNRRGTSVSCTVRSMSDRGARLDIDASAVLPETFELAIDADDVTRPCRIVAFADSHIEIEFA